LIKTKAHQKTAECPTEKSLASAHTLASSLQETQSKAAIASGPELKIGQNRWFLLCFSPI
jgi:hypothetical protein